MITGFSFFFLRSGADSNRCTWFCRPLPNRSATRPFFEGTAKIVKSQSRMQMGAGKIRGEGVEGFNWGIGVQGRWTCVDGVTVDQLTVQSAQPGTQPVQVRNLQGQVVLGQDVRSGAQLDVSVLAPGLHVVEPPGETVRFVKE